MPKYNHSYVEDEDGLWEHWTDRSGHDHRYVLLSFDDDNCNDDVGCRACGNPAYPDCKISCSLFDD